MIVHDASKHKHVALAMWYHHQAQYSDSVFEFKQAIERGYPETALVQNLVRDLKALGGSDHSKPVKIEEEPSVMDDGLTAASQTPLLLNKIQSGMTL